MTQNQVGSADSTPLGSKVLGATLLSVFASLAVAAVSIGYLALVFALNRWYSLGGFAIENTTVVFYVAVCIGLLLLLADLVVRPAWLAVFFLVTRRVREDQPVFVQRTCSVLTGVTMIFVLWLVFDVIFEHWQAAVIATAVSVTVGYLVDFVKKKWVVRGGVRQSA